MSKRRDYVSELQPPTGLFVIPQMIYECGNVRWIVIDRGKPNISDKNLSLLFCPPRYFGWPPKGPIISLSLLALFSVSL
jgi:hypothetical protein